MAADCVSTGAMSSTTDDRQPRYHDPLPEELPFPDNNLFLKEHFAFGHPLLPARDAWRFRDRWSEAFGREAPLLVEIGSGNGFFLAELALRNPDFNVIGIEIRYKRIVRCAKKIQAAGAKNALAIRYDATFLDDLFTSNSVFGLYVNHPDPWPKARHEKNRMVSRWFLEQSADFLQDGGHLRIKSDYHDNVTRVAGLLDMGPNGEPLPALPFTITGQTTDLDTDGAPWPDDIKTYYQKKMTAQGLTIAAIELIRGARGA